MSELRVLTKLERTCPICGMDNQCQHGEATCWCTTAVIPKHVLDMVPDELKGKACVCKSCVEKYS